MPLVPACFALPAIGNFLQGEDKKKRPISTKKVDIGLFYALCDEVNGSRLPFLEMGAERVLPACDVAECLTCGQGENVPVLNGMCDAGNRCMGAHVVEGDGFIDFTKSLGGIVAGRRIIAVETKIRTKARQKCLRGGFVIRLIQLIRGLESGTDFDSLGASEVQGGSHRGDAGEDRKFFQHQIDTALIVGSGAGALDGEVNPNLIERGNGRASADVIFHEHDFSAALRNQLMDRKRGAPFIIRARRE